MNNDVSNALRELSSRANTPEQAGLLRELAERVSGMETFIDKVPTLSCPCCGNEGAIADHFTEDTPIICGCNAQVMIGDIEDPAYINADECDNPDCLA